MSTVKNLEKYCIICRSAKTDFNCEICESNLCKKCLHRLGEEHFFYASEKPEVFKHSKFCPDCFDSQVVPLLEKYNETLERAKKVAYLPKTYRTFVHVKKKAQHQVHVENCTDRDEAILILGFKAAELGFNALIRAEVKSQKVRNHGYQKTLWSAHALPAIIDEERLNLDEYREEVWRRGY